MWYFTISPLIIFAITLVLGRWYVDCNQYRPYKRAFNVAVFCTYVVAFICLTIIY